MSAPSASTSPSSASAMALLNTDHAMPAPSCGKRDRPRPGCYLNPGVLSVPRVVPPADLGPHRRSFLGHHSPREALPTVSARRLQHRRPRAGREPGPGPPTAKGRGRRRPGSGETTEGAAIGSRPQATPFGPATCIGRPTPGGRIDPATQRRRQPPQAPRPANPPRHPPRTLSHHGADPATGGTTRTWVSAAGSGFQAPVAAVHRSPA